jgi:hypothetical protein
MGYLTTLPISRLYRIYDRMIDEYEAEGGIRIGRRSPRSRTRNMSQYRSVFHTSTWPQNPSWNLTCHLTSDGNSSLLWNRNFYNSPPLVPVLRHVALVHNLTPSSLRSLSLTRHTSRFPCSPICYVFISGMRYIPTLFHFHVMITLVNCIQPELHFGAYSQRRKCEPWPKKCCQFAVEINTVKYAWL